MEALYFIRDRESFEKCMGYSVFPTRCSACSLDAQFAPRVWDSCAVSKRAEQYGAQYRLECEMPISAHAVQGDEHGRRILSPLF